MNTRKFKRKNFTFSRVELPVSFGVITRKERVNISAVATDFIEELLRKFYELLIKSRRKENNQSLSQLIQKANTRLYDFSPKTKKNMTRHIHKNQRYDQHLPK